MGWHMCSTRRNKSALWMVVLIAIGVAMMSGRAFMGWWWIFLLIPLVFMSKMSRRNSGSGYGDDFEKPKRDAEKPKRSGRYVRSDDGELLEVVEDQPRGDDSDDPFYV